MYHLSFIMYLASCIVCHVSKTKKKSLYLKTLLRYALKILLKFLGYDAPNFKFDFGRVKKVYLQLMCVCHRFYLWHFQVNPARFLQYSIMYMELKLKLNCPQVS